MYALGELPQDIGSMVSLQVLTIAQNMLQGEIPITIGCLTALTTLQLSNNQISGMLLLLECIFVAVVFIASRALLKVIFAFLFSFSFSSFLLFYVY